AIKIAKKILWNQKLKQMLKERAEKMLLLPPRTRWLFHVQFIQRFLDISEHLKSICEEMEIDFLTITEMKFLKKILEILNDYSALINTFQADKTSSISYVLSGLLNLKAKLSNYGVETDCFCQHLLNDFDKRFEFIFDSKSKNFNLTYALSSFLNPTLLKYFDIESLKDLKLLCILQLEKKFPSEITPNNDNNKTFDMLDNLLPQSKQSTVLETYLNLAKSNVIDLFEFFENPMLVELKDFALSIHSTPSSSSSIERGFSFAGLSQG
ncbi:MAG: hypothetical protein MHPSP_004820, partial [Paramarteilia canceri]